LLLDSIEEEEDDDDDDEFDGITDLRVREKERCMMCVRQRQEWTMGRDSHLIIILVCV